MSIMDFEFFHRIDGFGLVPGNKTAGFVLRVSTTATKRLLSMTVSAAEHKALLEEVRARIRRAGLVSDAAIEKLDIELAYGTGCPLFFSTDPATGGSVGARPEDLQRATRELAEAYLGPFVEYTPHNVDSPVQAMVLMIAVQTWAEWAYGRLRQAQAEETPPLTLREIPTYGDLMTLEDFRHDEDLGCLTSDDGNGYYATETGMSDIPTYHTEPEWATHVVWFNR